MARDNTIQHNKTQRSTAQLRQILGVLEQRRNHQCTDLYVRGSGWLILLISGPLRIVSLAPDDFFAQSGGPSFAPQNTICERMRRLGNMGAALPRKDKGQKNPTGPRTSQPPPLQTPLFLAAQIDVRDYEVLWTEWGAVKPFFTISWSRCCCWRCRRCRWLVYTDTLRSASSTLACRGCGRGHCLAVATEDSLVCETRDNGEIILPLHAHHLQHHYHHIQV